MGTVRLSGIRKSFGDLRVVDDVDLEVGDGEFVVIVGPSGCGKSTLLRSIAGLEPIDAGTIEIDGKAVNRLSPRDRDVAMVFQSYALYPFLNVYENIAFGLRARKFPKDQLDSRVREAAALLALTPYLDRLPKQLSGGQRQRVAIGRAIVRHARVFLFDEPLSNLDAQLREEMRTEIKRLHGELRQTMIYVTHDQVEAMTLADRILLMRAGRIEQIGTPLELYNKPRTKFVASFLGTPTINFLSGTLSHGPAPDDITIRMTDGDIFPLPRAKTRDLGLAEGAAVQIGIRPDHMSRSSSTPPSEGVVRRTIVIDILQPTGSRSYASFKLGGSVTTAELPSNQLGGAKTSLDIDIDLNRCLLIDTATDLVIA